MKAKEILETLKKAGKPQTAAIYQRHGAGKNVFGTLTSEIQKLQKQVKRDHRLALELWETGNAEARILALQVADPDQLTRRELDRMIVEGPVRFLDSYLAALVAASPIGDATMRRWMKSADEAEREVGYGILSARLRRDAASISDNEAETALKTIEQEIHQSPNWARRAMNGSLIAIGVYKPVLRRAAIAAAKRIGTVAVDHGETGCKTPEAAAYIEKTVKRKA
jgi:3-methyladenine DNA glycosylase AlkD